MVRVRQNLPAIRTRSRSDAALPRGPKGIAAACSGSYWALLVPAFWYAGRPIGLGAGFLIAAVWRYAAASLVAAFATAALFRGTLISAFPIGFGAALEAVVVISSAFARALSGRCHPVALGLCASAPACLHSTRVHSYTKGDESGRRARLTVQMNPQTHPEAVAGHLPRTGRKGGSPEKRPEFYPESGSG